MMHKMQLMKWILSLLGFDRPKMRRVEVRFVPYSEGAKLVKQGWTLAPEEDRNRKVGWVFLEKLEPLTKISKSDQT